MSPACDSIALKLVVTESTKPFAPVLAAVNFLPVAMNSSQLGHSFETASRSVGSFALANRSLR